MDIHASKQEREGIVPKQVLTRRRSWTARIAVLAVVFSIFAVALPASAHSVAIDTSVSCPASTPSGGFTDIGAFGADVQLAINCLKAFGITQGTTATTYSPNGTVLRWQMALFLVRQAADHGITVPAPVSQGYTDIAGLPQATIDAINQVTQLGISKGTTSTTFSPNDVVTRWQMALFLHRLGTSAGITFSNTVGHNDFLDIALFSTEIQGAINALADTKPDPSGHLVLGTGASLFTPNDPVFRWAMALFLTRVLAADNVPPPSGTAVVVTPTERADQATGTARTYTATLKNTDGTNYTGQAIIRLRNANSDGTLGTTAATGVDIEAVDGVVNAGIQVEVTATVGIDGTLTFVVRHNPATAAADAIPQVIRDSNTNGVVDSGEAIGTGGAVFFAFVPGELSATEGAAGPAGGFLVCETDKADDRFVVDISADNDCDAAGLAVVSRSVEYDDNDIYLGAATSMTAFETALSADDLVTANPYSPSDGGQSTFNLMDDNQPALTVDAPTTPVDAATVTLTGTGNPGWEVVIYRDQGVDGTYETALDPALSAATAIDADGAWSVAGVPLNQGVTNEFIAVQRSAGSSITSAPVGGSTTADANVEEVPDIVEGAAAQPNIGSVVYANGGIAASLDPGDTLTLDFDVDMSGDFGGDSIQATDGTDTATLTHGVNATFSLVGGNIVITITTPLGVNVNGGSVLNNPVGFESATGVDVTAGVFNVDPDRAFTVA